MSVAGYYVKPSDLWGWLHTFQRANVSKNKVRKEMWDGLAEILRTPLTEAEEVACLRVPRQAVLSLQVFCLTDGRGADLSSDALLNFVTTMDSLRTLCYTQFQLNHQRQLPPWVASAEQSVIESKSDGDDRKQ